jgi:molybdopterin-containing oxidoreductase family membrane subunit
MATTVPMTRATAWQRALFALAAALALAGLGAAWYMEEHGHVVTGMNNQIVWGMPHVFAIFMIVAASGVLNVASIGTVFGQAGYKSRGPLSGLLSIALLAGGLAVLMLDLGRPERVIVAATHYNPTSVFAWNMLLYPGMFTIVAIYLWLLLERHLQRFAWTAGFAAFIWRIVLTTGTGTIFAFLIARQAYGTAVLPPLFVILSFAWGLAVFLLAQAVLRPTPARAPVAAIELRMRRLLGVFVAAALYFTAIYHLTNFYFSRQIAFERFILSDGGIHPLLFWFGYVAAGSLLPLVLLYHARFAARIWLIVAALLVIAGAFAFLFVFIIGGQAWPLELAPGYATSSSFGDGQVATYIPRWPEWLLGVSGVAIASLIAAVGARLLPFLPAIDQDTVSPIFSGAGDQA